MVPDNHNFLAKFHSVTSRITNPIRLMLLLSVIARTYIRIGFGTLDVWWCPGLLGRMFGSMLADTFY